MWFVETGPNTSTSCDATTTTTSRGGREKASRAPLCPPSAPRPHSAYEVRGRAVRYQVGRKRDICPGEPWQSSNRGCGSCLQPRAFGGDVVGLGRGIRRRAAAARRPRRQLLRAKTCREIERCSHEDRGEHHTCILVSINIIVPPVLTTSMPVDGGNIKIRCPIITAHDVDDAGGVGPGGWRRTRHQR